MSTFLPDIPNYTGFLVRVIIILLKNVLCLHVIYFYRIDSAYPDSIKSLLVLFLATRWEYESILWLSWFKAIVKTCDSVAEKFRWLQERFWLCNSILTEISCGVQFGYNINHNNSNWCIVVNDLILKYFSYNYDWNYELWNYGNFLLRSGMIWSSNSTKKVAKTDLKKSRVSKAVLKGHSAQTDLYWIIKLALASYSWPQCPQKL